MTASPQPTHTLEEPTLPAPKISSAADLLPSSPSAAGTKRPAASLLPPFEPLSSSPGLPRPLKRRNTGSAQLKYPTPVPTSSTGILSSSPPRQQSNHHYNDQQQRPSLARTASERAPLSAVPAIELPENGEVVAMGRSSNSSHYQLSANRLVSRVHVRARYIAAPSPLEHDKIEIICTGWNGVKLHCQGRTWELFKGDSFTSETDGTEIMLDVQDARVLIQWPKRGSDNLANLSDSSWDDSPRSQVRAGGCLLQSSPLRRSTRIESPTSPTPVNRSMSSSQRLQSLLPDDRSHGIEIYEDEPELPAPKQELDINASMRTEATASFSSDLSEGEDHDPDEENDPIVHSFGPFGANIASRMASISTKSPRVLKPLKRSQNKSSVIDTLNALRNITSDPPSSPPRKLLDSPKLKVESPKSREEELSPSVEVDPAVTNHVINQLAFSRLSSTPLSTMMQNLPAEEKRDLTKDSLRAMIEATACIGIIRRQGKDAAGKPLESEYYYVPEHDDDEQRRAAVVDGLRKPSLRNCRKQHKQYYWKRPKTP
ncbi:transcription factor Tos4 [Paramyrothecium foliicola]|nr:transcription factor Tos4 [Paramyrothecium foliicola]